MREVANFDLRVDEDNSYKMKINEAVNVIVRQGGTGIYYDTKENWDSNIGLVAERGGIYIYSDKSVITDEHGQVKIVPGIKVGDGTSYLIDMAFVGDEEIMELADHMADPDIHTTAEEKDFWNNKITSYISEHDSETLVLSKL